MAAFIIAAIIGAVSTLLTVAALETCGKFPRVRTLIIGSFLWISVLTGMIAEELKDCTYKTIVGRYNIPYVIGCELMKERFE